MLTGSHFDTTLNAGRYDGVVGVLGAIEAIRELRARGYRPRRTVEVIGFAGEEPRFGAGCIGSRAMTASITRQELDRMRDRDGVSVAEAMLERGLDPNRLADAQIDPASVHAFVELHIEQGAVLESSGNEIGVVTHIAAPHDLRVSLQGSPMHAGATPMRLRRDALVGAAEAVLELEHLALASASGTTVGTVGVMRISPSAVNVIPGRVEMDIDVRDSDLAARESVIEALIAKLTELSARRDLTLSIEHADPRRAGGVQPDRHGSGRRRLRGARGQGDRDDLRRLPRRDGARRTGADRDDLRPEQRWAQPSSRTSTRRPRRSTGASRCWRERWRAWPRDRIA